jgi:hypothetical protein
MWGVASSIALTSLALPVIFAGVENLFLAPLPRRIGPQRLVLVSAGPRQRAAPARAGNG